MEREPTGIQQRLSRLILTGFMGAGKSTVGAILARDLGWRFIDLDDVIEASSKRTIAEIFRELGEANFREQERQAVRQVSNRGEDRAGARRRNGGGRIHPLLVAAFARKTAWFFLQAALPELLARCKVEGKVRPLLAAAESLEARHNRRLPYYRTAHVTVETTGLAPQKVANRVLEQVSIQWLIETGKR